MDELQYSTKNKQRRLASTLSTFSTGEDVMMETREDGVFDHDEDMVSYVLKAAENVTSDDTDVFVLLVY